MVIRTSSNREIDRLIVDLASTEATTRDAAVARLTVIGTRAVRRLIGVAGDPGAHGTARAGAFRALEAIADPRAAATALAHLTDTDSAVAIAAVDVARVFLEGEQGVALVDRLTAIAVDGAQRTELRAAAMRALSDLDAATVKPLKAALANDPALTGGNTSPTEASTPAAALSAAIEGRLDAPPDQLRRALSDTNRTLPVTDLQRLIVNLKQREDAAPVAGRQAWMAARAAAHAALARQGSRLGVYDLRETFEAARDGVAVEFLTAVTLVGDGSCLESLATAYANARGGGEDNWWRRSVADAFRDIAKRERISKRHAVAKKIEKRWPGLFQSLTQKN